MSITDTPDFFFLQQEIQRIPQINGILTKQEVDKSEKFIKEIMKRTKDHLKKQENCKQGYIYAFTKAEQMNFSSLKIGATCQQPNARVKDWKYLDKKEGDYLLVFALLSKRYVDLQGLLKILYQDENQHIIEKGNLRIEWYIFKENEPVLEVITKLDKLLGHYQKKLKSQNLVLQEEFYFDEVLNLVPKCLLDTKESIRLILFGNSIEGKEKLQLFIRTHTAYFSRSPLNIQKILNMQTVDEQGIQVLATQFSNWLTLSSRKGPFVPLLVATKQELTCEDSTKIINSLQTMDTYFELKNLLVILTKFDQPFHAKEHFQAILLKWAQKKERNELPSFNIVFLYPGNNHKLSHQEKKMLELVEQCYNNKFRFNFGQKNHDIASSIIQVYGQKVRHFLNGRVSTWLKKNRTNKTVEKMLSQDDLRILKSTVDINHTQQYKIIKKMAQAIELDPQMKMKLYLYIHCQLRIENTLFESQFIEDIHKKLQIKRQSSISAYKNKFNKKIQKVETYLKIFSLDDLRNRKQYLEMIALSQNRQQLYQSLKRFDSIDREIKGRSSLFNTQICNLAITISKLRNQEHLTQLLSDLRHIIKNSLERLSHPQQRLEVLDKPEKMNKEQQ